MIKSVYDKHMKLLSSILISILIVLIAFVVLQVNKKEFSYSIIYNNGENTIYNLDDGTVTFEITVEGYNKTLKDIELDVEAIKGELSNNRVIDSNVRMEIVGTGDGAFNVYGPATLNGLTDSGITIGKIILPKENKNIIQKYTINIWKINTNDKKNEYSVKFNLEMTN